jgi:hypothetical protein
VPAALFPSHSDPQVAQVVLGRIAASIMTVVSIVFAILLMTLASMQFSGRVDTPSARRRPFGGDSGAAPPLNLLGQFTHGLPHHDSTLAAGQRRFSLIGSRKHFQPRAFAFFP